MVLNRLQACYLTNIELGTYRLISYVLVPIGTLVQGAPPRQNIILSLARGILCFSERRYTCAPAQHLVQCWIYLLHGLDRCAEVRLDKQTWLPPLDLTRRS